MTDGGMTDRATDRPVSRLDRMIARLTAQRDALDRAAAILAEAGLAGPVVEVGLGKGRTYSHLRCLFPERRIFCLDGSVHAPPGARPPDDDLILGDFRHSLADRAWLPEAAALIHVDCGTEDADRDAALIRDLSPLLAASIAPGGIVIADRTPTLPGFAAVPLPAPSEWPIGLWRAPDR